MRAVVYDRYGLPDRLKMRQVREPVPGNNEVLIQVRAASINSWDWDLLRGKPLWARIGGLLRPKYSILGADVAGKIQALGKDVEQFSVGDEVFGDLSDYSWGGFAEYVVAPTTALTKKPVTMSFEQAASMPQAGVLALQSLAEETRDLSDKKVLINGAGGGVGSFAIQIAKIFGAKVTAVDHTDKLEFMSSLGADLVIDYTRQDFTKNGQTYDLIIDVVAQRSVLEYSRSLKQKGKFIFVGGTMSRALQLLLVRRWLSRFSEKKFSFLIMQANKDLDFLCSLFTTGQLDIVIDRKYPLAELADAFRYFGTGQVRGKVVITP